MYAYLLYVFFFSHKHIYFFLLLLYVVRDDLTARQSILKQMLIDTVHIDRLRVNFVSHFNTDNQTIGATNEITDLIENYPKEMTSQLRQWLTDQQKNRLTAPLATVDSSKSIDDFDEYLREIEEHINTYDENEPNEIKLKVLLNCFLMEMNSFFLFLCRNSFNKWKNDLIYRRISMSKRENE